MYVSKCIDVCISLHIPQSVMGLSLFLKDGNNIKKAMVDDGDHEL